MKTRTSKLVLFVACDISPSKTFAMWEKFLHEGNYDTRLIAGNGKNIAESSDEIRECVSNAGIVVIGMSSKPELAEKELVAARAAADLGVRFGFYGDVDGCHARVKFWPDATLANKAEFYLGIHKSAADSAKTMFPQATVHAVGNPLRVALPSRHTREQARTRLGLKTTDHVIVVANTKMTHCNLNRVREVIKAIIKIGRQGMSFKIVVCTHPGEIAARAVDPQNNNKALGLYESLGDVSPVPIIIGKTTVGVFETIDMIGAADMVVGGFTGSALLDAAMRRVPGIALGDELDYADLQTNAGLGVPESCSLGVAKLCSGDSSEPLEVLIQKEIAGGYLSRQLQTAQEREFPRGKSPDEVALQGAEAIARLIHLVREPATSTPA